MNKYKDITIKKFESISTALKQMDEVKHKLLIVVNENSTFDSVCSIGDIQRAIINNLDLKTPIHRILRENVKVGHINEDPEDLKNHMKARRNEFMPVIDDDNNIKKVIFWENLFDEKKKPRQFDLPVVIMAGGKGTRMKPLTNIIPKPLIPINEKTIVEDIMDRFLEHGSNGFYLSVNYKADLIRYYFKNKNHYKIEYFQEPKPLGTAGSLSLLKRKINSAFFVSNCDILIDEDYSEILKYHKANENEITLVAVLKQISIPYGTLETRENGVLISLNEKPELNFKVNSGMYIIEPHLLDEIPFNQFYHITQLIENIINRKGKVGVFPVTEKSWRDMGNWDEYIKNRAF